MRLLLISGIICVIQGLIVGKCIEKREKRAICGGAGVGGGVGGCPGLPG